MINQNKKIITAHFSDNQQEKIDALKDLLSTPENELFNSSEFNFSNAGLKYKVFNRQDVNISRDDLIDNSFAVFSSIYNNISIDEFNELKIELLKLPIETSPVIHYFQKKNILI